MVATQLLPRGISDEDVLRAMRTVPRHRFVPDNAASLAYGDYPLSVGHNQTISQPYIVALMTQLAGAGPGARVLEVGTGSGYQTAVLAEMGADVYSVEILEGLATQARETLNATGYRSVHTRVGDAGDGWQEHAPYDAIVVTAAPRTEPPNLRTQLAPGGRLVIPVGLGVQQLNVVTRTAEGFRERSVTAVQFVPLTGRWG